jgi:hypothetical protein
MVGLRFTDLQSRPTEFLDFTSLTLDECQPLVPPFEAAFHAHMRAWRLDGKRRTARRFTGYQNCPLPTPEGRLLFILACVKTSSLPSGPGTPVQYGAEHSQSVAPRPLARAAGGTARPRRCLTHSLTALAQRLGASEANAAFSVTLVEAASMRSASPRQPRIPYRLGASCCRIWASWRSRCPRRSSSCRPSNHAVRS